MDKIDSLLNDARSLSDSGDFDKAKLIYLSLIESNNIPQEALISLGHIALQAGNIEEGIEWLEKSIILEKKQPQILSNLGVAYLELGKPSEAISYFNRAIKIDPYIGRNYYNLGIAYAAMKNYKVAIESYKKSIQLDVKFIDAHINLGNIYLTFKKFNASIKEYQAAINLNSNHLGAWLNLGIAFRNLNQFKNAKECFRKVLNLDEKNFEAHINLGFVNEKIYKYEDAILNYKQATEIKPSSDEPYVNLASVYLSKNQLDLAIKNCQIAIKLNKNSSDAYVNLGNAYNKKRQYEKAINQYDRALSINSSSEEAFLNKSLSYLFSGWHQKAMEMNQKATEINPKSYEGLTNFALIFNRLGMPEKAIQSCQLAIDLKPESYSAYVILADIYAHKNEFDKATYFFDIALKINKDGEEALVGMGNVCLAIKDIKKAIKFFYEAYIVEQSYILSYMHCKTMVYSWDSFDIKKLIEIVQSTSLPLTPFMFLNLADQPLLQKKIAIRHAEQWLTNKKIQFQPLISHKKIRIAYFSADFHSNHPVAHLTHDLFEMHDRNEFEIYIFSFISEREDLLQSKIKKSCDAFIDASSLNDEEVVSLARQNEIDIAIDLSGYTLGSRTAIFSMRAAPIQINYLGYPGTMGTSFIDYIISDEFIIPCDKQNLYTEKIIYLPGCFQPNNSKMIASTKTFTRKDENLPEEGFVFCSFNNTFKLLPSIFDIWMRILNKVKGSVLWLASCSDEARINLRNEAIKRGISGSRLIFADRKELHEDHLARLKLGDLFLDSFPYNAHTTASDALRSEVPLLTLIGESFASRVAGSLLNSLNLNELIMENEEAYEIMAIRLALNTEEYRAIKEKLKFNISNADLYNSSKYTKNLESAYVRVYKKYLNKELPENLNFINE